MENYDFLHSLRNAAWRPLASLAILLFSFACSRPTEGLESLFLSMEEIALEGNEAWSTPEKEMKIDGLPALKELWEAWEAYPSYFSLESQGGPPEGPKSHSRFRAIVCSQDHYAVWHKPYADDELGYLGGEEYQEGEVFWSVGWSGQMEGASAWKEPVDEQKQFFPKALPFGPGVGLSPIKQMLATIRNTQATMSIDEKMIHISLVIEESGIQKTTILTVSRATALPDEIRILTNGELEQMLIFHDFRILKDLEKSVVHFDEYAVDFFLISDDRKKKD